MNFKNLGPKPLLFNLNLKKVPGYDELYINRNGTLITQYGYIVDMGNYGGGPKNNYLGCLVSTSRGCQKVYVHQLVMMAYGKLHIKGRIVHLDSNTFNNDFDNLKAYTNKEYCKRFIKYLDEHREANAIKSSSIPQKDVEKVKKRLLKGDTLKNIANDYGCSDMAIVRFKKRYFSKDVIDKINKNNGINTKHTDKYIIKAIIDELKQGVKQYIIAEKYKLSPTIICRINRQYIKENKKLNI